MKTFVFSINEGWLVGIETSNGCANCVDLWLTDRQITHTAIASDDLPIRRDILDALQTEKDPAVLYEISKEGETTRLECRIDQHPKCGCSFKRCEHVAAKKLNFAFTSIQQMKATRYGTSNGNVWLVSATNYAGETYQVVSKDRETGRLLAANGFDAMDTKLDQIKNNVLAKYSANAKAPMLVVGTNSYLRSHLPFFLLQQFDLHIMFYPQAGPAWLVGVVGLSRSEANKAPVWSYGCEQDINKALEQALLGLLIATQQLKDQHPKLTEWTNQWIYRCPKIALKDVLHLETYPTSALNGYEIPKETYKASARLFRVIQGGGQTTPKGKPALQRVS